MELGCGRFCSTGVGSLSDECGVSIFCDGANRKLDKIQFRQAASAREIDSIRTVAGGLSEGIMSIPYRSPDDVIVYIQVFMAALAAPAYLQ